MALTGRFTFRRTWSGRIVLQVEDEVRRIWPLSRWQPTRRRWRDARPMDLAHPSLRPLLDLRVMPLFHWERLYGVMRPSRAATPPSPVTAAVPANQNETARQVA